jgi:hypothetical protein
MPYLVLALAAVAALFLLAAMNPNAAAAKGKRISACVVKKGPDKGAMHFSRKGKCHKGEKKISWNKKGMRGKKGATGPQGNTGPEGPSGVTDELLATIAAQQAAIDQLTSQLSTVTTQLNALKSQVTGLAPQVAALCTQMQAVTTQVTAIQTVTAAVIAIVPVGPALPAALSAFSCP